MADLHNMENAGGQDTAILLKSLVEDKALERWQQYFCDITNVFMCCVDNSGFPLTGFGGRKEEADKIREVIDEEQLQDMMLRVSESTLEEQAIETTAYPNLRLAVISARVERQAVVNWLVCGVISDAEDLEDYEKPPLEGFTSRITERQFAKVVDALKAVTDDMLRYRFLTIRAREESRQSRCAEKEMKEDLKRAEALMEIVQLLDNDEPARKRAYKLLKAAGELLGLSIAAVYSVQKNKKNRRMISQWCKKDGAWEPGKDADDALSSLLRVERALILSGESMLDAGEKEDMQKLGLKAVIVMPVKINKTVLTCACFGEMDKERTWKLEEIKFLNACVKVLHSIL